MVASSSSMLRKNQGAEIDRHSAIIRFNDAPTKGFEKQVGATLTGCGPSQGPSVEAWQQGGRPTLTPRLGRSAPRLRSGSKTWSGAVLQSAGGRCAFSTLRLTGAETRLCGSLEAARATGSNHRSGWSTTRFGTGRSQSQEASSGPILSNNPRESDDRLRHRRRRFITVCTVRVSDQLTVPAGSHSQIRPLFPTRPMSTRSVQLDILVLFQASWVVIYCVRSSVHSVAGTSSTRMANSKEWCDRAQEPIAMSYSSFPLGSWGSPSPSTSAGR